mgnify:CR=1 FL=1|tara:strand:- start:4961 stop:8377 length:3417 start_codon:yes stop_codon:yes gene_type:complete
MKIQKYLKSVRSEKIKLDLARISFVLIMIFTGLLLILILLESVFYFSPLYKKLVLLTIIISYLIILLWLIISYIIIKQNRNKKYSWNYLAKIIGKVIFPRNQDIALNAFQIESQTDRTQSKELADTFIDRIAEKINNIKPNEIIDKSSLLNIKLITTIVMLTSIVALSIFWKESADAFYRWKNYNEKFLAPKPFKLYSLTRTKHILGGEKTSITIRSEGGEPDSVLLKLIPTQITLNRRDSSIIELKAGLNTDGLYRFELPELFQDYEYNAIVNAKHFYQAWQHVKSPTDTIFVTDRPKLNNFEIKIIPPPYSKLPSESLDGSVALVQGLKGSIVNINLESNRNLKSCFINLNDSVNFFETKGNEASGKFIINDNGKFSVHLVDPRDITNRDPIPYHISILPDNKPVIKVNNPPPVITLGNNQIIQYELQIEDDYGFSNLQLAYEIRRPEYLRVEPYIAMFRIPELNRDIKKQVIKTHWNLFDLMLMPDDEVYYHFELSDNDEISGPKKTISKTFIAKVPSLSDLYEKLENEEENINEQISESIEDLMILKDEIDNMELNILKTEDELKWEEQQKVKEIMAEANTELKKMKNISDAIESLVEQSEKHELLNPDLMEKFKELSNLLKNIIPQDLLDNLNIAQSSLEEMDLQSLQEALENMSNNISEIESELDRYIDIFKRLQAEQKLTELINRLEKLVQQKDKLDRDIESFDNTSDEKRIWQEELRGLEELADINAEIQEASELIKPFSQKSSIRLDELKKSNDFNLASKNIQETISDLKNSNIKSARSSSQLSLNSLNKIQNELASIQQEFQNETVAEMAEKLEKIMRDILFLSKEQEQLRDQTLSLSRNSSILKEMASKQQVIQDQLNQTINQMIDLSKETFSITPQIGKSIGQANNAIEQTKSDITDRDIRNASKNQNLAMEGLNSAALNLFQSVQEMQSSGSASGFEQFLKMMQQMAGQQQGLNQQGMNLSLGQMSNDARQQILQSMLNGQKNIQKTLQELIKEIQQTGGQQGNGDLNGIARDMEEVISDLSKFRYSRKTKEKQRRILSRMLDSQTSLAQRGYKDERKAFVSDTTIRYISPGGLPIDLGQRQNIALDALNRSLNSGYTREYQTMIKRYFNSMTQIDIEKNEETIP